MCSNLWMNEVASQALASKPRCLACPLIYKADRNVWAIDSGKKVVSQPEHMYSTWCNHEAVTRRVQHCTLWDLVPLLESYVLEVVVRTTICDNHRLTHYAVTAINGGRAIGGNRTRNEIESGCRTAPDSVEISHDVHSQSDSTWRSIHKIFKTMKLKWVNYNCQQLETVARCTGRAASTKNAFYCATRQHD